MYGGSPTPFVVLAVLTAAAACVIDVRVRRIPNVLTFGATAVALALRLALGGPTALLDGAAGWLVGLVLLLPFFVLRGLGGGDVKLLAAFGACLGPGVAFWAGMYGMIAGGLFALALALGHGALGRALGNVSLLLTHWRVAGVGPVSGMTLEDSRSLRLAYALPLTCGLLVALWLGK